VLFADLCDEIGTHEIDRIVKGVKDSQREVEVLAARNKKVVLRRAHGLYTIK
jgi:hypothetical protein